MKARLASLLLACLGLFATAAVAAVPSLLSYQGRVSDAAGVLIGATSPVNRTVTFKFYSASTGGTPLYAEAQTVTISAGEFSVLLGNGTGVSGFKGPSAPALTPYISLVSILSGNIYLGVTVDDGTTAADPEIAPRQQIVSAAYAYRAQVAETVVDGALGTTMIANSAVTTDKLGGASVTSAKIATDAVTSTQILSGSVTTAKLADGNVTNAKLAANVVTADKIADGNVLNADIADNAITNNKILDGTIVSADIADATIATADLADSSVSTAKVAANAIDYNRLATAIQQALSPTGTILAYAGDTAPSGWQLCDGTALNRTTYSALFAVVGTRFGYGDSSNFRVPDLRGQFLRGRDFGVGRDPDRASRTAMNSGGATGDAVGSVQSDQFRSHTHNLPTDGAGGGVDQPSLTYTSSNDENWSSYPGSASAGGAETRPTNAYVNFIIKL
jgi:microcystin-dependent protein